MSWSVAGCGRLKTTWAEPAGQTRGEAETEETGEDPPGWAVVVLSWKRGRCGREGSGRVPTSCDVAGRRGQRSAEVRGVSRQPAVVPVGQEGGTQAGVPATPLVAEEPAQTAVSLVGNYRGEAAWGKWRPAVPRGRMSTVTSWGEPFEEV